jgi:two-component system phosphate regulon sensor histidine kinase PhoR
VVLAAMYVQLRRERAATRSVLHGDGAGPLPAAARRALRGRVDRVELSEALALRDALMAALPLPVLLFDASGRLVRWNRPAREALPQLARGTEAEPAALATAVRDAIAGRPARPVELTVYEPERRRYHAHVRGYPGRDTRLCAVVLEEESEEADFRDARSLFSAGVSHELRTPLARMLALVDTLSLPLSDTEREEMHDAMRDEIDGMRRLIEEMVLLVRLESGEQAGRGESADVTAAVTDAVARHARSAELASVDLAGEANRGLLASIAPPLLDVVLDNLVANAIRHAGAGANVGVRARGLSGAVEIEVSDDGAGIDPEHLPHVFERFYRVEGSRSGPGTGLGLAVVKHVAEAHNGRAEIESSLGTGTAVRVILPTPAARRLGRDQERATGSNR